jgi:hypothetical protein
LSSYTVQPSFAMTLTECSPLLCCRSHSLL